MTPDEARDLLDNFDRLLPFEAELELEGAAKDMARTIARMREEWGAERQVRGRWVRIVFALNTLWTDDRAIAESAVDDCRDLGLPARTIRRYVTEQEVADAAD